MDIPIYNKFEISNNNNVFIIFRVFRLTLSESSSSKATIVKTKCY